MLQTAPLAAALLWAVVLASPAAAQAPPHADPGYPKQLPAAGGHVVIPSARAQGYYDSLKFAPARRAGDYLYISGVIAGRREGEGKDVAAFKAQVRRAFGQLQTILAADGLGFADVVMINSFHVWNSPDFDGSRDAQFEAFAAVKDEFMTPPHPAWTAVGSTGLLSGGGIVEIQMIAYAPKAKR